MIVRTVSSRLYTLFRYTCTHMARKATGASVSASAFRAHLFRHLGTAAAGHPVRIQYKGAEYQLSALNPQGKLDKFYSSGEPEPVIDDPSDEWFSDDPSLKRDREREWVAKWDRRRKSK